MIPTICRLARRIPLSRRSLSSMAHPTISREMTAKWLQPILEDNSEPPRLYAWTLANLKNVSESGSKGDVKKWVDADAEPNADTDAYREKRRIYILGVGNIGRLYAACLAKSPKTPPITLVVHRRDLLEYWRDKPGIQILGEGWTGELDRGFDIEWWTDVKPDFGPVKEPGGSPIEESGEGSGESAGIRSLIVATKAADAMPQVDRLRRYLGPQTEVAFAQNGMCKLWPPFGEIYARHRWGSADRGPKWRVCVTTHGVTGLGLFRSLLASPASVAVGTVGLGVEKGKDTKYLIKQMIMAPGLAAERVGTRDIWVAQLEKLVVNSIINPLTVVLACKNGKILNQRGDRVGDVIAGLLDEASRTLRALVQDVSTEAILLSAKDVTKVKSDEVRLKEIRTYLLKRFTIYKLQPMLYDVGKKVAENTSSMLQDVKAGKKTEIEDINGWLVEMGKYLDVENGLLAHEKLIALVESVVESKKILSRDQLVRHFFGG
ncbi:6-phosphogluconate dehydrogenase C-terminal domain-like protein [Annulohypoxylon stygium]|nr:6-phosphogluconate dehydrogenase C-terminal domain-like protein [Annulohypoxylon stygium]